MVGGVILTEVTIAPSNTTLARAYSAHVKKRHLFPCKAT